MKGREMEIGQKHIAGKRAVVLFLVFSMLLFLGGCGRQQPQMQAEIQEKPEKLQIGMSFDSFVIERWIRDRDFFTLTAKNLGAEVNVQTANGEVEEQISQIRYFIKKKMDVIVVIAVDGTALSEVVAEAKAEGIRVIAFDRLLMGADEDLYISFDNEMVGTLMAQALVEALPDGGNIFMINGSPTDYNVTQVQKGFYEVLENSGLNVVYTAYCENWLAELAYDAVEEGLAATPRNLAGVMCGNDDLAGQAFRALAENRLAGKVSLVGQDGDLAACQRVVEGTQTMTVYKPVEELAKTAAEFAAALGYDKMADEGRIAREDIPEVALQRLAEYEKLPNISVVDDKQFRDEGDRYFTANDGVQTYAQWKEDRKKVQEQAYEIPYYAIEPVAVTAENMDEVIIESDFHTEEDVYLNTGESQ